MLKGNVKQKNGFTNDFAGAKSWTPMRKNPSELNRLRQRYGVSGKLTKSEAIDIAISMRLLGHDFHSLNSDQLRVVQELATLTGYKKPASANGSKARYFYAALNRSMKNPSTELNADGIGITKLLSQIIKDYKIGDRVRVTYKGVVSVWEKTSANGWGRVKQNGGDLIASSATLKGLEKILKEFFYSPNIKIKGSEVHNSKGRIDTVRVEKKAGRYHAVKNGHPVRNDGAREFKRFQAKRLADLSKMFQGAASGERTRVLEPDAAPKNKYRLGHLVLMKIKNNGKGDSIEFDGEAYLSGDLRNNLWITGKDARVTNIPKPRKGQLKYLGELTQVDYVTAKKHIESGQLVRFWHPLGEVDKEYPKLYIDHDGFPIIIGGGYDVWDVGIVN